jgi:hypothetical protein
VCGIGSGAAKTKGKGDKTLSKLLLTFENSVLKEAEVLARGVKIGRGPDNGIVIDNPAVSHYHARVFTGEDGQLTLEDLGSLNGTFVNGKKVKTAPLKTGDSVGIGKHKILVEESTEPEGFLVWIGPQMPETPKMQETAFLGTKERSDFLQRLAAKGESSQVSPERGKVPMLIVRKGKTDAQEYLLNQDLTVIGKSAMATIKLQGWFAPKAAAQINRRGGGTYYIGAASRVPTINGNPTTRPTKLIPGDIIEVAGIELEFQCHD